MFNISQTFLSVTKYIFDGYVSRCVPAEGFPQVYGASGQFCVHPQFSLQRKAWAQSLSTDPIKNRGKMCQTSDKRNDRKINPDNTRVLTGMSWLDPLEGKSWVWRSCPSHCRQGDSTYRHKGNQIHLLLYTNASRVDCCELRNGA